MEELMFRVQINHSSPEEKAVELLAEPHGDKFRYGQDRVPHCEYGDYQKDDTTCRDLNLRAAST